MTEFLFDGGYITNLAAIVLVLGWTFVGVVVGFTEGQRRAEHRAEKRMKRMADWYQSYYSHPSNQR